MQKVDGLTADEAFAKAAARCSVAECCTMDIRKLMDKWGVAADGQEQVLERLRNERYIDERRYSECFVRDKFRYNQWGRVKIAQALRLKGIPDCVCREALDAIDPEEYSAMLRKIIQSKARGVRAASDYERRAKLARFAIGRGFEAETVMRCLGHGDEDYQ